MNLKKFKKKTQKDNKSFYNFDNVFEYLKIIRIVNYYTLEVIIYNDSHFNKWFLSLKDVNILDDKLSPNDRETFKNFLESLITEKYYKFKIHTINNGQLESVIFLNENSDVNKVKASLNTILSNNIINCVVVKEKLNKINNIDEGTKYNDSVKFTGLKNKKNIKKKLAVINECESVL